MGILRAFAVTFLLTAAVAGEAASAQKAGEWRTVAVANAQSSAGAALSSTDGRSSIVIKCDKGDDFANMTFQFIPKAEIGLSDMPRLYEVDMGGDAFPFQQLWTRIPDRAAYLESNSNGELPEVLATFLARPEAHLGIDAKDKTGKPFHQEFRGSKLKTEHLDAVFTKCHGKTLTQFGVLIRGWTFEQGKSAAGKPVYTAWLPSMDNRVLLGMRCTYTDDDMVPSLVVKSIHSQFLLVSPPSLIEDGEDLGIGFRKIADGEWEWINASAPVQLPRALIAGDMVLTLLRNNASDPSGTLFLLHDDSRDGTIKRAMAMCNIPV